MSQLPISTITYPDSCHQEATSLATLLNLSRADTDLAGPKSDRAIPRRAQILHDLSELVPGHCLTEGATVNHDALCQFDLLHHSLIQFRPGRIKRQVGPPGGKLAVQFSMQQAQRPAPVVLELREQHGKLLLVGI